MPAFPFLSASNFNVRPYKIPNLSEVEEEFDSFLENEIEDILIDLLGPDLYAAFVDGMSVSSPEDRWANLYNGDTYTYLDRKYTWKGMEKMLIPYVFAKWLKADFDNYGGNGITIAKMENSESISPNRRFCNAWNEFAEIAGEKYCFKDTLYGYLIRENGESGTFDDTFDETFSASFDAYLNFYFKAPGFVNQFDL